MSILIDREHQGSGSGPHRKPATFIPNKALCALITATKMVGHPPKEGGESGPARTATALRSFLPVPKGRGAHWRHRVGV